MPINKGPQGPFLCLKPVDLDFLVADTFCHLVCGFITLKLAFRLYLLISALPKQDTAQVFNLNNIRFVKFQILRDRHHSFR